MDECVGEIAADTFRIPARCVGGMPRSGERLRRQNG
jgi:hypothetical protein